ncbi:MAG: Rap1a/Tai family immunity protein [Gammaproteobacteria bacterium]|jgi:opacity protein-like surface antigen
MTKKILLAAAALLFSSTLATAADAPPKPFMTGAQWLGMYESDEAGKEAAAAYVAGYVDGVQSAEATSRKKRFCVPETVTEVELADEVAKYLAGKSVFRQMGAPFVIDGALKDSYPC